MKYRFFTTNGALRSYLFWRISDSVVQCISKTGMRWVPSAYSERELMNSFMMREINFAEMPAEIRNVS